MRILPFKQVLQDVAYKFGLDPDQGNFLTNEAIAIGTSIDQWVRRVYDSRDFPEWTTVGQFTPDARHIVSWDAVIIGPVGPPIKIGRVFTVYLVDPTLRTRLIETRFTEPIPVST
jgi:hypothetical protein